MGRIVLPWGKCPWGEMSMGRKVHINRPPHIVERYYHAHFQVVLIISFPFIVYVLSLMLSEAVGLRTRPAWDQKIGFGLASLVLCCERRSCHARRHNDLEGHSNFSSAIYSFSILCLERGYWLHELTRGLATLPQRWIQEPFVVRDRDGRPPRGPALW